MSLLNVLQSKIKGYSFEDLYGNLELVKKSCNRILNSILRRHYPVGDSSLSISRTLTMTNPTGRTLSSSGGHCLASSIEKREKMKQEAEIGLLPYEQRVATKVKATEIKRADQMIDREREMIERKRFDEITRLIRERLTDDKMNEFKNAEDLEKYLYSIDTGRVIRENDMIDLKKQFEDNRQDRAYAREMMIQSIGQRHQLDMKAEVQAEEVKGQRLYDDYDLEKRSKISGQDVKEAEAGIELLRKMKAGKTRGRHRLPGTRTGESPERCGY